MYIEKLNFIRNKYLYLIFLPLLINFLTNVYLNKENLIFSILKNNFLFFSFIISSFTFYLLAKAINDALDLNSLSLSICYFLSSFFLLEFILFPITSYSELYLFNIKLSFKYIYVFVAIFWIVLLFFKKISIKRILILLFAYSFNFYFNRYNFEEISDLSNYIELNSDVPNQWFVIANQIFHQGLFHSFTNNLIAGQGLFLNHIQTTLFRFNFPLESFQFIRLNSFILLTFTVFLIIDLNITKKNKILLSLIYFVVILNSNWLTYLFIDSLMLEGIVSLFFAVYIYNSKNYLNNKINKKSFLFYLFFSLLLFSKEFISTIVFLYMLFIFIYKKNTNLLPAFLIFLLDKLYSSLYISSETLSAYIGGNSIFDLVINVLTFKNLDFSLITKIIEEVMKDRIVSIIYVVFFFSYFFKTKLNRDWFALSSFCLIIINLLFIITLYISWWKNVEVQSSFRYILNTLHLIIISIGMNSKNITLK